MGDDKNLLFSNWSEGSHLLASAGELDSEISVYIVRAFIKIRQVIAEHKEISRRIALIENSLVDHDEQIIELITAMNQSP